MEAFVFMVVDVRGFGLAAGVREVSPMDERLAVDPVICFVGDFTGDYLVSGKATQWISNLAKHTLNPARCCEEALDAGDGLAVLTLCLD